MKLVGSSQQQVRHYLFSADGVSTGAAQLVLAQSQSRSALFLQNISDTAMFVEFDSARAAATLANGAVASVAVTNAGFNFTLPPVVRFLGGGSAGNGTFLGLGQPGGAAPSHVARAHAVLTAGAVSSIVVDDPGAGYVIAPYVLLLDSDLDPYGCAVPSATSGFELGVGSAPLIFNGTMTPTGSIALYCASSTKHFTCRWSD